MRRHLPAPGPLLGRLLVLGMLGAATGCSGPQQDGERSRTDLPEDGTRAVAAGSEAGLDCGEGSLALADTLSSGATWSLCFSTDAKRGMLLRQVTLTPPGATPVLIADEISLAQLEVPYDTGDRLTSDITSYGFGGLKMQSLTATECPGELIEIAVPNIGDGTKFGEVPVRAVLCSEREDAGLAYRSEENGELAATRQDAWSLSTISKVGWYEYVSRYTFGSDGSISPDLGATGDLSPVDYTGDAGHGAPIGEGDDQHAASHAHNAVWRIDWSLGGGPLAVEQYDALTTRRTGPKSPVVEGRLTPVPRPASARRAPARWWRVLAPEMHNADGHPVSYQVDLRATDAFTFAHDQRDHGRDAGYDVAFTNSDPCQLFATDNDGGCGAGVLDYVQQGSAEALSDVVSWVAVGFHHVPRDEDQSPMQLHWQGFTLTPRDLTAQRMDPAPGRESVNGQPEKWNGEDVEDLEAFEDGG